ncbi:MAG: hypothetical protein KME54_12515 [Tolypothrix brevis GSE-NOS-MK-07-07A]|nr:hypothetical protein [Tolypothrix brevis GSE-NOS-MK-07-07A]
MKKVIEFNGEEVYGFLGCKIMSALIYTTKNIATVVETFRRNVSTIYVIYRT